MSPAHGRREAGLQAVSTARTLKSACGSAVSTIYIRIRSVGGCLFLPCITLLNQDVSSIINDPPVYYVYVLMQYIHPNPPYGQGWRAHHQAAPRLRPLDRELGRPPRPPPPPQTQTTRAGRPAPWNAARGGVRSPSRGSTPSSSWAASKSCKSRTYRPWLQSIALTDLKTSCWYACDCINWFSIPNRNLNACDIDDGIPHKTPPKQTHWASEVQARPEAPRLWRALLRAFVPLNLSSYPLYFLASMARILQAAVGMNGLVRALEEPQRDGAIRDAYLYAGVIVVMGLANFLLLHQVHICIHMYTQPYTHIHIHVYNTHTQTHA